MRISESGDVGISTAVRFTREPPLRPRLVAAATKLARGANGDWSALIFEGEAGMGVSATLHSVIAALDERRVPTLLFARSSSALPGYLWLQFVRNLSMDPQTLQLDATGLLKLRTALSRRAEAGGRLVIAIDDIDLLSEVDFALVEDLLAYPAPGLAVLAGMHRGSAPVARSQQRLRDFLTRRIARGLARRFELAPLTGAEILSFTRTYLRNDTASRLFADDLRSLTSGRADYLLAMLRSLVRLDASTSEHLITGSLTLRSLPPPTEITSAVASRLALLSGTASELFPAIAMLAPAATVPRLADITGKDEGSIELVVQELAEHNFVQVDHRDDGLWVGPTTPVEGEAAIQALPSETRDRLQSRVARRLDGEVNRDPETVLVYARNVLASSLPVGPFEAGAVIKASESLIERSRYETARRMLERMLKKVERSRVSIPPVALVQLAEVAARAGDMSTSSGLLAVATAEAGKGSTMWYAALRRQARDYEAAGLPQDALRIYHPLLDEPSLDASERIRVLIETGSTCQLIGDSAQALHMLSSAESLAVSTHDESLASEATWRLGRLKLEMGETPAAVRHLRDAVRHARLSGDSVVLAHALGAFAAGLWHKGRPRTGTRWLAHAVELAGTEGNLASVSALSRHLGWFRMEMGDALGASRALDESAQIDTQLHRTRGLHLVEPLRAVLSAMRAAEPRAAASGLAALNDLDQAPVGAEEQAIAAFARATLRLYAGHLTQAHEEATRALNPGVKAFPAIRLRFLTAIAAICAASTGDSRAISMVLADMDEMPAAVSQTLLAPSKAYVESLARLTANDWQGAYASAWRAGESFERQGLVLRAVMAFELASQAALQGESRDKAANALHQTYSLMADAGLPSVPTVGGVRRIADLRDALRKTGARIPQAGARHRPYLTERQLQIAVLASRSLSDAAIAARLEISRRTVTTHMSRILHAAGLRSRIELAGWLEREGIAW